MHSQCSLPKNRCCDLLDEITSIILLIQFGLSGVLLCTSVYAMTRVNVLIVSGHSMPPSMIYHLFGGSCVSGVRTKSLDVFVCADLFRLHVDSDIRAVLLRHDGNFPLRYAHSGSLLLQLDTTDATIQEFNANSGISHVENGCNQRRRFVSTQFNNISVGECFWVLLFFGVATIFTSMRQWFHLQIVRLSYSLFALLRKFWSLTGHSMLYCWTAICCADDICVTSCTMCV